MEIISLLEKHLGKTYQTGHEALFHCPFCGHQKRKLSINTESHAWKCWVCDRKGFGLVNLFFESKNQKALMELSVHSFLLKKKIPLMNQKKSSLYLSNTIRYV